MVEEQDIDYIKILIVGDSGVGKSSILSRFTEEVFDQNISNTIGIDYKTKDIIINNKTIKLRIWDSAGQERYKAITYSFFKNALGIIIVYDQTNQSSFQNVENWLSQIKLYSGDDAQIILVGNKADFVQKISVDPEKVKQYCETQEIEYCNVSAKSGENIQNAFILLTNKIFEKRDYMSKQHKNNNSYQNNQINYRSQAIKISKSNIKTQKTDNDKSCFC